MTIKLPFLITSFLLNAVLLVSIIAFRSFKKKRKSCPADELIHVLEGISFSGKVPTVKTLPQYYYFTELGQRLISSYLEIGHGVKENVSRLVLQVQEHKRAMLEITNVQKQLILQLGFLLCLAFVFILSIDYFLEITLFSLKEKIHLISFQLASFVCLTLMIKKLRQNIESHYFIVFSSLHLMEFETRVGVADLSPFKSWNKKHLEKFKPLKRRLQLAILDYHEKGIPLLPRIKEVHKDLHLMWKEELKKFRLKVEKSRLIFIPLFFLLPYALILKRLTQTLLDNL